MFGALPNRELDFRSGSAHMLNLGLDLGLVQQGLVGSELLIGAGADKGQSCSGNGDGGVD
jgi:hypothetical protein